MIQEYHKMHIYAHHRSEMEWCIWKKICNYVFHPDLRTLLSELKINYTPANQHVLASAVSLSKKSWKIKLMMS